MIKNVRQAVKNAYAPYSRIKVAAVLYCSNGETYSGVNIENASLSLTVCAERVALYKALSNGVKSFPLMLIYSPQIDFITPCGACLQVLAEFNPRIIIATMNSRSELKFLPLKTLIRPFTLNDHPDLKTK
jgi:cytidine deaminase